MPTEKDVTKFIFLVEQKPNSVFKYKGLEGLVLDNLA